MKVKLQEAEGCWSINMTAEDIKEAAALARFGASSTIEIRHKSVIASAEGEFTGCLVLGKAKNWSGYLK